MVQLSRFDNGLSILNISKKAEGLDKDINQDFSISAQKRRNDRRVRAACGGGIRPAGIVIKLSPNPGPTKFKKIKYKFKNVV